jgi:hypothetical protein
MGKKSQERMTGETYEQRMKHPTAKFNSDVKREEKVIRRNQRMGIRFAQLMKSGAVKIAVSDGKVKVTPKGKKDEE